MGKGRKGGWESWFDGERKKGWMGHDFLGTGRERNEVTDFDGGEGGGRSWPERRDGAVRRRSCPGGGRWDRSALAPATPPSHCTYINNRLRIYIVYINFSCQRWKSQRSFWRKSRDFVSCQVTVVGFFLAYRFFNPQGHENLRSKVWKFTSEIIRKSARQAQLFNQSVNSVRQRKPNREPKVWRLLPNVFDSKKNIP
jgi:hypothetical protein